VIGTLMMLGRHRLVNVPRETWIAMAGVFALALIARLIDLGGAGQTWDEDVNWAAGRNYVTNLLSLDFSEAAWKWNFEHPPVMKLLAGIGAQFSDGFGPARALSALWVALGCGLLVPVGVRLYSRRVGVLAAAIAALLPPLVAHGQIVGHEAPTVLWWPLAILLSLSVHDALPGDPQAARRALAIRFGWVGAVIGIAVASRFINGLLGIVCAIVVVISAPPAWRRTTIWLGAIVMTAVAVLTFYALWPRLWPHPAGMLIAPVCIAVVVWFASRCERPIWQLAVTAAVLGAAFVVAFPHARDAMAGSLNKLSLPHAVEPFLGALTNHPGPHYFAVYLFATLPAGVVLGVLAYGVRLALDRSAWRSAIVLACWLVIPLAVAASPVRQDGVRYVMPSILALAVIAAAGFDYLLGLLERRVRHAFMALAAVVAVYLGITLVRAHPYYLDYFAEQVGGTGTVAERRWFETAWWGEGLDRAIDYVNANAAPGSKVHRGCVLPSHLTWFREDLWNPMVTQDRDAEWIVVYAPMTSPCRLSPGARKVFEVAADGAILAEVYRR
jgi:4-amino-4-deoxy-L-arabinose transferase-like glycosyltransferase